MVTGRGGLARIVGGVLGSVNRNLVFNGHIVGLTFIENCSLFLPLDVH